jgi:putative FmdB family regulatory protein
VPTYQYACTACDHRFDAVQSFSEASLTECPECGGKLRKLYGSVGVVFKGSGFYRTDSRSESKSSTTASSSDKSTTSSSSDKSTTTTTTSSSTSSSTDKVAS